MTIIEKFFWDSSVNVQKLTHQEKMLIEFLKKMIYSMF